MEPHVHQVGVLEDDRLVVPSAQLGHDLAHRGVVEVEEPFLALRQSVGVGLTDGEGRVGGAERHLLAGADDEGLSAGGRLYADMALDECEAGVSGRIGPHVECRAEDGGGHVAALDDEGSAGVLGHLEVGLARQPDDAPPGPELLGKLQTAVGVHPDAGAVAECQVEVAAAGGRHEDDRRHLNVALGLGRSEVDVAGDGHARRGHRPLGHRRHGVGVGQGGELAGHRHAHRVGLVVLEHDDGVGGGMAGGGMLWQQLYEEPHGCRDGCRHGRHAPEGAVGGAMAGGMAEALPCLVDVGRCGVPTGQGAVQVPCCVVCELLGLLFR